jgi:hypothetical protein
MRQPLALALGLNLPFAAVYKSVAGGTKRLFAECKAMSGVEGKADLPVERPDFSL